MRVEEWIVMMEEQKQIVQRRIDSTERFERNYWLNVLNALHKDIEYVLSRKRRGSNTIVFRF